MKSLQFTSIVFIFFVSSRGLTEGFLIEPCLMSISDLKIPPPQIVLDSSSSLTLVSMIQSLSTQLPSALSSIDPFTEAEIFSDAAHVALDLTTFFGPTTITIRLFAVLGRLFCIASDYIPDHTMRADDFFFQFTMLAVASTALAQSLVSIVNTYNKELTMRDRKCFVSLFYPGGFSWMQYKVLATSVLEWKELPPGSIITTEEFVHADNSHYLYWLYNGEVLVQSKERILQKIAPKNYHLFGDLSFVVATLDRGKKRFTSDTSSSRRQRTTSRAGRNGAIVLRIDTLKLKQLMEQDESIDRAIRDILMESMHERITALLVSQVKSS